MKQQTTSPEPVQGMTAPVAAGELAVVVGAGSSGLAAARLLRALGARVRLLERNESASPAAAGLAGSGGVELLCGPHTPEQFHGSSLVVTSPGVPLGTLAPLLAKEGNLPLLAETELALRFTAEPVLAVTGTSGKTTTASLAAAMLRQAGKRVFLGGNIGTPLSEYVLNGERAEALVLELSSFQLQATHSLHPRVALLLNLTANHLDHHKDMNEYTDAKFRVFARQTERDLALLPEALAAEYEIRGCKGRLRVLPREGTLGSGRMLGAHNAANAEAACLAVSEFGVTRAEAAAALAAFLPIRHRLEPVGELGGVVYVNDSKSTTVASLRVALRSFDRPVVLLAGGKFKGGDLASLADLVRAKARAVALFGASREVYEAAFAGTVPLFWDANLPAAVARARLLARPGDAVLLSPAAASFDLYDNYGQRGDHFCDLARSMGATPPEQTGEEGQTGPRGQKGEKQ